MHRCLTIVDATEHPQSVRSSSCILQGCCVCTCMHAQPECWHLRGAPITHAQVSAHQHVLLLDPVSCCSNGVMEMTRGVRSQLQGLIRYVCFLPQIKSLATLGSSCLFAFHSLVGSLLGVAALYNYVLTVVAAKIVGLLHPVFASRSEPPENEACKQGFLL